jgi:hypothetical protein
MAKAWGASIIAIVVVLVAYLVALATTSSSIVAHSIWAVPVIGAAVGAFVAPRSKFNLGAATVLPAVIIIGAATYFAGRFGIGDFVGAAGTGVGMLLSLPFIIGASVVGALLGEWASKGKTDV